MPLQTSIRLRTESAPRQASGELPATPSVGFGRMTAMAGVEDALAAVRTAVLLARTLGATLRLYVLGSESLEIHFGHARCDLLLAGLADSLRERLTRMAARSAGSFNIEINFSDLPVIAIRIHSADPALK